MTTRVNVTITRPDGDVLESIALETTEFDSQEGDEYAKELAMSKKLYEHITRRFGEVDD